MTPFFRRVSSAAQGLLVSALVIAIAVMSGYIASRAFIPEAVEAQTYVRPSKGKAIEVVSAQTVNAGTSTFDVTSSTYDWTAFAGVQLTVSYSGGSCGAIVIVSVIGGEAPATQSIVVGQMTAYGADTTSYLRVPTPYVKFYATQVWSPGILAPGGSCTYTVYATPLPFSEGRGRSASGLTSGTATITNTGALLYSYSVLGTSLQYRRFLTIQNQGTVPVYCDSNPSMTAASTSQGFAFTLAAGTAAYDGTGGSITLEDYKDYLYCATATSSAVVSYFVQ